MFKKKQKEEKEKEIDVGERLRRAEEYRKGHTIVDRDQNGRIQCSCGMLGLTDHIHALHIEQLFKEPPFDASGWPSRHFTTVPYAQHVQRGVVSKGDLDHALFLSVNLTSNVDHVIVRQVVSEIPSLISTLETSQKMRIVGAVGFSPSLWSQWDAEPPTELIDFPTRSDVFPAQPEDTSIFLFAKGHTTDICFQLSKRVLDMLGPNVQSYDRRLGFRHNPIPMAAHDLTADISHTGGSYLYAGRFEHDLKKFSSMSAEEKNHLIGRDYSQVHPHVGYDTRPENPPLEPVPEDSHIARAHASVHRHAYPYADGNVEGLYFVASGRSLKDIDAAMLRMSGVEHNGVPDNLFKITKAITSGYYYTPSLRELSLLPSLHEVTVKQNASVIVPSDDLKDGADQLRILIEYCTNCGYKSIYIEKKKLLESMLSPGSVSVIGNPRLPRQSAFEVITEDGTVLWSKLAQPDGRNNFPWCFPSNEVLSANFNQYLQKVGRIQEAISVSLPAMAIYVDGHTRVGVW